MRSVVWCGAVVVLVVVLGACTGSGQQVQEDSVPGGDLSVAPGFGEVWRSGVTGSEAENTRSCHGFYPAQPQHRLTLEGNLLETVVEADTTEVQVWIRFGQNDFCSKAEDGVGRIGRGAWTKGEYEVFVGTTKQGGAPIQYKLRFAEVPR